MTACVSVSNGCRPPVFGDDAGCVIDDLTVPEEKTHGSCFDTHIHLDTLSLDWPLSFLFFFLLCNLTLFVLSCFRPAALKKEKKSEYWITKSFFLKPNHLCILSKTIYFVSLVLSSKKSNDNQRVCLLRKEKIVSKKICCVKVWLSDNVIQEV